MLANRSGFVICAVILIALWGCLGAVAAEQTAFAPGPGSEVTAWLIAGPFDEPLPALEEARLKEAPLRGGAEVAGTGTSWRVQSRPTGRITLPSRDRGGIYYVCAQVAAYRKTDGLMLGAGSTPFLLRGPAGRESSEASADFGSEIATVPVSYSREGAPVMVRLQTSAGEPAEVRLFAAALTGGQPRRLPGMVVSVPGRMDESRRKQWFSERVELDYEPTLLTPGSFRVEVRWTPGAPLPVYAPRIDVRLVTEKGREVASWSMAGDDLTPARLRDGIEFRTRLEALPGGDAFALSLSAYEGDTYLGTREETTYSREAARAYARGAKERLSRAEADRGEPMPVCRLMRLHVREIVDEPPAEEWGMPASLAGTIGFGEARRRFESALEAYRAGRDPIAGRTGVITGAYVSDVDGSVQPYRLYVPESADPASPLRLVVLYHGYVPSYTRTSWMQIDSSMAAALEEAGVALLLPFARSNTDFLSVGEVDAFDSLAHVIDRYDIDPARLGLAGYSMGGSGVWTTLGHYPGNFCAARVWSGRTDYYLWHELAPESVPDYLRLAIDADNPVNLYENLRGVPIYVKHPLDDALVKPGHTQRMRELLGDGEALSVEMPPTGTHWSFSSDLSRAESYRPVVHDHRLNLRPASVEIATYTPKYGTRAWLRIQRLKEWGRRAYVKAAADPENGIRIEKAENVAALAIDLHRLPKGVPATHMELAADGKGYVRVELAEPKAPLRTVPESLEVLRTLQSGPSKWRVADLARLDAEDAGDAGDEEPQLKKTPALCGPVKEAFNRPFLLVRGTAGDEATVIDLSDRCRRFRDEWLAFAKGEARVVDDVDLTGEQIRTRNLICFGTPRSNAFLRQVAEALPFRFPAGGGYGVAQTLVEPDGGRIGFVGCYPNPAARQNLLVIMDGLFYGEHLSVNHKWDLVPDYIVFSAGRGPRDTNRALLAGYFDASWQFDKRLQYRPAFPPER